MYLFFVELALGSLRIWRLVWKEGWEEELVKDKVGVEDITYDSR